MDVESALAECLNQSDDALDLARATLLIACAEYPELNIEAYLARLDEMAAALRPRLPSQRSPAVALTVLNQYLFKEQGFSGNIEDYYDPRNSFFNEVLDRKTGIPITLSILYLEIAWRLGLPVAGVSFPGHFLVKLELDDSMVVLDPFFGGLSLGESELMERLTAVSDEPKPSRADLLRLLDSTGKKDILARLLRNLKNIYVQKDDLPRALAVYNRIIMIGRATNDEFRERGLILEKLDCGRAAIQDYRRYLAIQPDATDRAAIEERITDLEYSVPRLN
ncbi:MAG: transglutaminase-like domain-containing protein [Gammaproteobacteria bacterium]